ncbi:MAG: beta strand repeat-containing protein, partial [Gemmataceae bacterium]
MALSWFRSLLGRPARRTPYRRPHLEGLETRLAPATWDGGGVTNNWSDRFNWVGDVAPVTGNPIVFPATNVDPTSKNNVNDFADNRAFSGVQFTGQGFTVTGQSIQILGGTVSAGTGTNALNLDVNFSTLTLSSGGTLTLGGVLAGGNVTKTGAGSVVLVRDNPNFTGLMTVNAGRLVVASSGALGANGTAANGTLVNTLVASNQSRVELSGDGVNVGLESLTLNGFAAKLVNANGSGNNSWAGPVSFPAGDANSTLRGITSLSGQLTLTGVVSSVVGETGAPQIEIEGQGLTVFAGSASNSLVGLTRVSGGRLVLQKDGGAQALTAPLRVNNSGIVRWAGNDQIPNTVPLTAEAGTLDLDGFSDTLGPLNLDLATVTTGAGTLTLNGTVTQGIPSGPGGTSTIAGNLSLGAGDRTFLTNLPNGTSTADDLRISAVIQGTSTRKLIKEGTGRLVLSGANLYEGQTVVNAGRLIITNAQALGAENVGNNQFLVDGTDVIGGAALELRADAGSFTVNEDLRIAGTGVGGTGAALRNLSGDNTWANSVAFSTFSGPNIAVGVDGSSRLAFDGLTFGASTGIISKVGTGDLVFTGSAISDLAGQGQFQVKEGTVTVQGSATVGDQATDVFVFAGAALNLADRTADFNQENVHLNGAGVATTGALRLLDGSATSSARLFLDTSARIGVSTGATLTQTGVISGAATSEFRKVGGGNLILDAANTFGGFAVVAQGTVTVRDPAALGATTRGTTVQPGATLAIDQSLTVSAEPLALGVAGVAGETTLAASETSTWTGPVTLNNSATVRVDGPSNVLRLNGTVTAATTFTLTKKGTATLSLGGTAANTAFDGPVIVNEGTLALDKPGGTVALDGNLTVGDAVGAAGTAVVTQLNSEQLNNLQTVTVQRDGLLNLSNENETIARLVLVGGSANTGTGTLSFTQGLESQASADTATVTGNLNHTGTSLAVTVADGTAITDLVISGVVTDFINKGGSGALAINGNTTSGVLVGEGLVLANGTMVNTATINGSVAGTSAALGGV